MILIGISGKKHAGKDTVAEYLAELLRPRVTEKLAFAKALKEEVAKACGVSVEYIEQHKDNFRRILQGWGTDYKRDLIDQKYWLIRWLNATKASNADVIVVPDVRFENEANLIKKCDGLLIRVERLPEKSLDVHASEINLDGFPHFDATVYNHYTLARLRTEVEFTLQKLKIL